MTSRTVSVKLQAEIGGYLSNVTKAAVSTRSLGDAAEMTGKKAQRGFDLAGRGAVLFGAGAAAALVGIVTKAADFEKAMSAVQAATQASTATLGDLREAAIKAGADTQYSATQAADAITEMAKAGVSSADILKGGLAGALSLAAAGQLEVADAAGIAATALTQFGLSGEQLPHVADLLAAGAGKAMGSVSDLSNALKYIGPVAAGMGISIEETTGTLALFASQGILSEQAGTSLRGMLTALTSPSAAAAKQMETLGISVFDAQGNFVGLDGVAGQLHDSMSGLTEAERSEALGRIFGNEQITAARVLYQGGAQAVQAWTEKVDDSGFAARQAAQLTDNLSGDLERLGGAFDTLLISMGQGAQGPLRDLVQGLTTLVDAIAGDKQAFESLPAPVRAAISAVKGVADVVGAAVKIFLALPGPLQNAVVAAGAWAIAGGKIMDVLRPMGGALGSLRGGWQTFGEALGYARANGDGLGTVLRSVGSYAGGEGLQGVKAFARAIGPELGVAAGVFVISNIVDGFKQLAGASDEATAAAEGLAKALTLTDQAADRRAVRQAIEDTDGLIEALDHVGISSQDAINGLLGQEDAQRRVTGALREWLNLNPGGIHDKEAVAAKAALDAYNALAGGYGTAAANARYFAENSDGAATAATNTGSAAAAAAPPVDALTQELQATADAADASKQATDRFKLSLDALTGAHVSMLEVQSAFFASLDAAKGALDNVSGSVLTTTGSLNLQSEAGRKTSDTLINLASDASTWIATMIEQGATADEAKAKDAELRQSFWETAFQMTGSRDAADKLTDSIYGIPEEHNTRIDADTHNASSNVSNFQRQVDDLHGKTVTITVVADRSASAIFTQIHNPNAAISIGGGLATGGPVRGPGGPTDDRAGLFALSNDEHVWTAREVHAAGGHAAVEDMRKQVLAQGRGFAAGGAIQVNMDSRPLINTALGVFELMKKAYEPGSAALAFARSQVGKPYVWGGVGPGGYDCSGFMSAITNVLRGRNPYSRVGSTATFPWAGFAPGYGSLFTIGSAASLRGGVGHMAGNLMGVNVESAGGVGVRMGAGARGPDWGYFNTRAHLAMAGGGVIGEPVVGRGLWSNRSYSFAEHGDEVVLPRGRERAGGSGGRPIIQISAADLGGLPITGTVAFDPSGMLRFVDARIGNDKYRQGVKKRSS